MKPYQLLVFDFDGTLIDSSSHITGAFQAACRDLHFPVPNSSEIRPFIGVGIFDLISALFPKHAREELVALRDAYRQHFFSGDYQSELFPGALDTLTWLNEKNYLLGIATGKGRYGLDRALNETGIRDLFVVTRTVDEAHAKPHPQMLIDCMDMTGVIPEKTLMIGDTDYDLLLANNAGVDAVALTCGMHDVERLKKQNPIALLEDVTALPGWLLRN